MMYEDRKLLCYNCYYGMPIQHRSSFLLTDSVSQAIIDKINKEQRMEIMCLYNDLQIQHSYQLVVLFYKDSVCDIQQTMCI